jgi:hypothetical protein
MMMMMMMMMMGKKKNPLIYNIYFLHVCATDIVKLLGEYPEDIFPLKAWTSL